MRKQVIEIVKAPTKLISTPTPSKPRKAANNRGKKPTVKKAKAKKSKR
jgi:hypothetical protein